MIFFIDANIHVSYLILKHRTCNLSFLYIEKKLKNYYNEYKES